MQKKIHWFNPGNTSNDLEILISSNLASTRLRTAVACKNFISKNYEVTIGDSIINEPNIIFIGKIGGDIKRFEYWLNQLIKIKENKVKIYLDYTDNHLGFESPMRKFYEYFVKISDHIIVPSEKMKDNIKNYWTGPTTVIPDIVEVEMTSPKYNINKIPRLLWFGHASNIEYLVNYVKKESLIDNKKIHLTVMSNLNGLELFNKNLNFNSKFENINLLRWSKEFMSEVAKKTDISLIPSSKEDPKKSGVSSNRLLTSLALGLPTLATTMPSYEEFDKYFLDINIYSINDMIKNLKIQKALVVKAQNTILKKYSKDNISELWLDLIETN